MTINLRLFYFINSLPHPAPLNELAPLMHYGTRGAVIYLPLLLLLLKPSYRKLVWQIVASAAATMLLVDEILKPLIKESRPFETLHNVFILPPLPTSFSFPSSETAAAR